MLGGERALSDNAAAAEGSPEQEEDDEEVTEVLAELSALDLRGQLGAQEPWYNLPLTGAASGPVRATVRGCFEQAFADRRQNRDPEQLSACSGSTFSTQWEEWA